jgi:hypothetical protein
MSATQNSALSQYIQNGGQLHDLLKREVEDKRGQLNIDFLTCVDSADSASMTIIPVVTTLTKGKQTKGESSEGETIEGVLTRLTHEEIPYMNLDMPAGSTVKTQLLRDIDSINLTEDDQMIRQSEAILNLAEIIHSWSQTHVKSSQDSIHHTVASVLHDEITAQLLQTVQQTLGELSTFLSVCAEDQLTDHFIKMAPKQETVVNAWSNWASLATRAHTNMATDNLAISQLLLMNTTGIMVSEDYRVHLAEEMRADNAILARQLSISQGLLTKAICDSTPPLTAIAFADYLRANNKRMKQAETRRRKALQKREVRKAGASSEGLQETVSEQSDTGGNVDWADEDDDPAWVATYPDTWTDPQKLKSRSE